MKMLITGAAGFIGSQLARTCLEQGHDVTGVDALTNYYAPEYKRDNLAALNEYNWHFVEGDLTSIDLGALLEGVEVVFHLAAQPGVRTSWGSTFSAYVDNNVVATQRLLEAARDMPLRRFVFASSSSVYGDAETLPTGEDTPLLPISPYGATKAVGEHLLRVYRKSYGLPYVTLRYFTVYGPRQRPDMAFYKLIDAALARQEITIFGNGNQTRDFTFAQDAVDGTLAAALRGQAGHVYNLGGGARTSINEVLEIISQLTGNDLSVRYERAQDGDARDTAADTTAARTDLGYAPSRSLREGLREQVDWQRRMQKPAVALAGAGRGVRATRR
jgi:nucleoside-diphosphate-sugar epimerase